MSCYIRLMEVSVPDTQKILKSFRDMWEQKDPVVYRVVGSDNGGFSILALVIKDTYREFTLLSRDNA